MSQPRLVGLNVFRAVAIFMMMAAHSIRIQSDFVAIANNRDQASFIEHFLLVFIDIEPIISAMFLFVAGFSLTLSFRSIASNLHRAWLNKLLQRAGMLYGVAVIFFIAEHGFQWPDMLISAGVLGIIALSIMASASMLLTKNPLRSLTLATLICLATTYFLEMENLKVTGLNAGAGGILPLIVMGFLGTIYGLIYQRFGDNGLFAGLFIALVVSLFSFTANYPNTFVYTSQFNYFSPSPIEQLMQSLLSLVGQSEGAALRKASFWNHASIYPLRFTAVIMLFMVLSIKLLQQSNSAIVGWLNGLGSYGLTIYIYHLLVLAILEVTGLKPQAGWQTLAIILLLMASGYVLIRNRLRIDPDTA